MHHPIAQNPLRHNGVFLLRDGREVVACDMSQPPFNATGWVVGTRAAWEDGQRAVVTRYGDLVLSRLPDESPFCPASIAADTGATEEEGGE